MLTGLCMGLLVAAFIYINGYQLNEETLSGFTLQNETQVFAKSEPVQTIKEENILPEPTYEFYKLLPDREINISEWITEDEDKTTPEQNQNHFYVFQVGSFKEHKAADQVKAQLALIGLEADIQRVVLNEQDTVHRVRVGPYKEQTKLNEISKRLRVNGLEYTLLTLRLDEGNTTGG